MSAPNGNLPSDETATLFTAFSTQFPVPGPNGKITTVEFLQASTETVNLIKKFGKIFTPIIYDMNGNITKLSNVYDQQKEKYEFIEDMVLKEIEDGHLVAVDALQWLRRALHFISIFFKKIIESNDVNKTQDLSYFIKLAYEQTLQPYHGWMGMQLFNILARFTPNRRHLFYTLGLDKHNKEEHVIRDMIQFNEKMFGCVNKLLEFYEENDLDIVYKV